MAGTGRLTSSRRAAPRSTWPTRWEQLGQPAGEETTRATPPTWSISSVGGAWPRPGSPRQSSERSASSSVTGASSYNCARTSRPRSIRCWPKGCRRSHGRPLRRQTRMTVSPMIAGRLRIARYGSAPCGCGDTKARAALKATSNVTSTTIAAANETTLDSPGTARFNAAPRIHVPVRTIVPGT